MSGSDECSLPGGHTRVLRVGTLVLAAAGAAVLVLGAQDARLLRLGLVAALWAALLGAFAVARMRREISSGASRADALRAVYQLELEREVIARREHTRTVERELREQVQQAERGEIVALRAELAALRASLEKLMGGAPRGDRVALWAESARLLPLPAHPSQFDDSPSAAAAPEATAKTACGRTAAGSYPESRFGPGRYQPELDTHARPPAELASSGDRPWSPAVSSAQSSAHSNGSGARREAHQARGMGAQRSVSDLLAAHGDSVPRRRRSREAG